MLGQVGHHHQVIEPSWFVQQHFLNRPKDSLSTLSKQASNLAFRQPLVPVEGSFQHASNVLGLHDQWLVVSRFSLQILPRLVLAALTVVQAFPLRWNGLVLVQRHPTFLALFERVRWHHDGLSMHRLQSKGLRIRTNEHWNGKVATRVLLRQQFHEALWSLLHQVHPSLRVHQVFSHRVPLSV